MKYLETGVETKFSSFANFNSKNLNFRTIFFISNSENSDCDFLAPTALPNHTSLLYKLSAKKCFVTGHNHNTDLLNKEHNFLWLGKN